MMALLLAAAFPVIVFLVYIYRKDTIKEPPGLLWKCFFFGCIATVPIVFAEAFLNNFNTSDSAFWHSFYDAFVVAAFVEEGFKLLFLYLIIWKRREFDQYFDGIVYAVFVSLGFAFIENILYVFDSGIGTAIMRAILSIPGHGLGGVMMGYFFSLAKFSPNKQKRLLWLSLLVPLLFHGLYDFFLMLMEGFENGLMILLLFGGFVAVMILIWRSGIRYIKKHYAEDKGRIYDIRPNPYL